MSLFSKLFGGAKNQEPEPPESSEPLVHVPMLPLITLLVKQEKEKGAPLSEAEVWQIRDKAICVALPASEARAMAEARGYDDIDPAHAWEEWRAYRSSSRA